MQARPPEPLAGLSPSALLAGVAQLPRELDDAEIVQLLDELPDDLRLVAFGLLSGLSIDEITRLEWAAVDIEHRRVRLTDRTLRLSPVFERQLDICRRKREEADGELVIPAAFRTREAVDAALLYAAHDAGLPGADEITAASLRHSYVAYLVRQGVRFADLAGIVGRIPADLLSAYTALSPAGRKRALDEIDVLHPALRALRVT
jgi:integrase